MKIGQICKSVLAGWFIGLAALAAAVELEYAPAPADNPLKGLVPYVGQELHDRFVHSMEFRYFPLRDLMDRTPEGTEYVYNWRAIEKTLEETSARGCQLIFRVFLEYPGKPLAVPQFLVDDGVKITEWTGPDGEGLNRTPDYEDPRLRQAMKAFIAAVGRQYDGDRRVAFLTAGMLGKWGEWHDYPREDLFAGKQVQREVMDAFAASFKTTHILLRYPAGPDNGYYAANHRSPFGYHDDSFAFATLDTGRRQDDWFFMARLQGAGPGALEKWKSRPIGGEIRPELWPHTFTDNPHPKQQDFAECVRQTHVTWLMDTGLFSRRYRLPEDRKQRAIEQVRRMGYELHIATAEMERKDNQLTVTLTVENRGVAPFYYDWPVQLAVLDSNMQPVQVFTTHWKLTEILPGEPVQWHVAGLPLVKDLPADSPLAVRVPNPMPTGKPLRFANAAQTPFNEGWLLL